MTYPRIHADKPAKALATPCYRCGGSGIFHTYGQCFRCFGQCIDPTYRDWGYPVSWTDEQCAEYIAKREARNAKARATRVAKAQAAADAVWDTNISLYPVIATASDLLDGNAIKGGSWAFVHDVVSKAHRWEISERQAGAVAKIVDAIAEREAADALIVKAEIVEGRQVITGEVVTVKGQETRFGWVTKILVKVTTDQGEYKVWGTCPSAIEDDVTKGCTVAFTAEVTRSDDDPTFGFYSRPTKASVLGEAVAA